MGNIWGGGDKSKYMYVENNSSYVGQHFSSQAIKDIYDNSNTANYKNLEDCINAIKKNTGSTLEIVIDQPTQITGFLSSGEHFGCVEKVSDEKGTYVDGWYTLNSYSISSD